MQVKSCCFVIFIKDNAIVNCSDYTWEKNIVNLKFVKELYLGTWDFSENGNEQKFFLVILRIVAIVKNAKIVYIKCNGYFACQ
jgi:hypothetical protein